MSVRSLLRSNRYLYDVQFRPLAVHDGVVDIEVVTRDTWSLDPGFSAGRSGGANSSGLKLREYNVFGTGVDTRLFGSLFARFDLEYVWPLFSRNRVRGIKGGALFWSAGVFTFAGDSAERKARRAAGEIAAPLGFNANFGLRLETAIGVVDLSVGNVLRRTPL